ncbi:FAD-dependent thymidylate synthase, partial [Patescibacteria group bacterium]|nr:FAD-dependent thymidylate synthase [Patescibacteria group bacterium]
MKKAVAKRIYKITKLPIEQNLDKFSPPYTPEKFTKEEKLYLKPFFSNLDKPVFVATHLPEEVIGALSSRYSRSTKSIRRMFLDEYVYPIIHPEEQKGWDELSAKEKKEAEETKKKFLELIIFLDTHGGIDYVVNVQRGRKFFDRWLAEYGDDSIAELGGVHIFLEGLSIIATKEIEDKRVGISPLEKSTRYVSYADKRPDGGYLYITPAEIKESKLEKEFKEAMDGLFEVYVGISEPYLNYVKELYPKGEDETEASFNNSRSAKRFDDIRDLLPFSTQTNVALFGNGRAFEDLINRLLNHELGEMRWWGKMICQELEKVVPSFVRRPQTERGAEVQFYRSNLKTLRQELAKKMISS